MDSFLKTLFGTYVLRKELFKYLTYDDHINLAITYMDEYLDILLDALKSSKPTLETDEDIDYSYDIIYYHGKPKNKKDYEWIINEVYNTLNTN